MKWALDCPYSLLKGCEDPQVGLTERLDSHLGFGFIMDHVSLEKQAQPGTWVYFALFLFLSNCS